MKTNLLVIAGLAVLSTNAFASKARVQALGQDVVRGSHHISDSRNIFRNPARLNETKNYLVTEWGTSNDVETVNAPRAEGGFFRESGAFNYGLYLGNNEGNDARVGNYLDQDNALDLFLAGDMGMKWGARLHYASGSDQQAVVTRKNSALGLGLGVIAGAAEGYLNLDLSDTSKGRTTGLAADEWKISPSYLVGGSYTMEKMTAFASYEGRKSEEKVTGVTTKSKSTAIIAGVGHSIDINPTARIYTDAKVVITNVTTGIAKTKSNTLPVTLGFEADATSWLTVRGSVSQNVILNSETNAAGKKKTNDETTTVNAGATLNFGKLKVDGLVGTTNQAGTATSGTSRGVLQADNLMSRVGVSYWF